MSNMYVPFGGFDEWMSVVVDEERWTRVVRQTEELQADRTGFEWLEGPLRASAYQSGAIEGMHPGDRGLTVTLMAAVADWQEAVRGSADGGGAEVVDHIRAGVDALHLALDVATNETPISEAWIRHLHEVACAAQTTYRVNIGGGRWQEQLLPKGTYKSHDNHVLLADGSMLEFAPAADVAPEMERLVADVHSLSFGKAHPVVQAAFIHQALTHIHPFADGNGRVARVLASVFLLRSLSLPLFLFADEKETYLDDLAAADRGAVVVFVEFVLRRVEDLAGLLFERRRASGSVSQSGEWRSRLDAAARFATTVDNAISAAERRHNIRPDRVVASQGVSSALAAFAGNVATTRVERGDLPRFPSRERKVSIEVGGVSVAETLTTRADLEGRISHPLEIETSPSNLHFEARFDEVRPVVSAALELRLEAWLEQVVLTLEDRFNRRLKA